MATMSVLHHHDLLDRNQLCNTSHAHHAPPHGKASGVRGGRDGLPTEAPTEDPRSRHT